MVMLVTVFLAYVAQRMIRMKQDKEFMALQQLLWLHGYGTHWLEIPWDHGIGLRYASMVRLWQRPVVMT
jgi:hypothetical protein